jgi:hypothetical protein
LPGRRRQERAVSQGAPAFPAVAARTIDERCSAILRAGTVEVRVAALDDVILSKEAAGWPKDIAVLPVREQHARRLRDGGRWLRYWVLVTTTAVVVRLTSWSAGEARKLLRVDGAPPPVLGNSPLLTPPESSHRTMRGLPNSVL